MSGIALVLHLNGRSAKPDDLAGMLAEMARRGPDGQGAACDGPVALGHRLLASIPEAGGEPMPFHHPQSGCCITGHIRLDNRKALLEAFALDTPGRIIGDGELVVHAWLRWGEDCAAHLLGDFAFAIWDARRACVFAARDQMGMRQLIYTHRPGRIFACASSARAVVLAPGVPMALNERRLAEAMISFEHGDLTATMFADIWRLPAAHCLICDDKGLRLREYWKMVPPAPLRLKDDRAYAEAFREVLEQAVHSRLRGVEHIGAMLSGGMDSGAVVALACRMTDAPLPTFSSVGPDAATCVETRAIHAALTLPNLAPTLIDHSQLGPWRDDLIASWLRLEEPFDFSMTLPRTAYLAAQRAGLKVVLDGVAGDVVLGEGSQMARHLRAGQWRRAWRDAKGLQQFWGEGSESPAHQIAVAARGAVVPGWLRLLRHRLRGKAPPPPLPRDHILDPGFAARAHLIDSLIADRAGDRTRNMGFAEERIWSWPRSGITVGRERYDRIAADFGIEARDPYMDLRVRTFCLSLPMDQFQADGWPKIIQRRAMEGLLPDAVRWRRGKEHLGGTFTESLCRQWPGWADPILAARTQLQGRARADLAARNDWRAEPVAPMTEQTETLLSTALLLTNLPAKPGEHDHLN